MAGGDRRRQPSRPLAAEELAGFGVGGRRVRGPELSGHGVGEEDQEVRSVRASGGRDVEAAADVGLRDYRINGQRQFGCDDMPAPRLVGERFRVGVVRSPARSADGAGSVVVACDGRGVLARVVADRADQPLSGRLVTRGTIRPRYLLVGDIADQGVREGVLVLCGEGRRSGSPKILAADQVAQDLPHVGVFGDTGDTGDRSCPERLPDNGGRLEDRLGLRLQRVETRGDDGLDRLRKTPGWLSIRRAGSAVLDHANELLGVQRVAAGALQQLSVQARRQRGAVEHGCHQLCGLAVGQRGKPDRRDVGAAAAPRRGGVVKLRSGRRDQHHRNPAGPLGQVVDEVQHDFLGPVQVFDQHDQR